MTFALAFLIAATPDEMRAALPAWTKTPSPARTPRSTASIVAGTGSYEDALDAQLPAALRALPHVALKNTTLRHLTAVCWSVGVELRQAPQPFLFPPAGSSSTLHALPPAAMTVLASASDAQLAAAARKLARSAAFVDFALDVADARELLKQVAPVAAAIASGAGRVPFVLEVL